MNMAILFIKVLRLYFKFLAKKAEEENFTWNASTHGTIAEVMSMSKRSMDNVQSQEPEKAAPFKNCDENIPCESEV